jgi:hypothetical protein
MLVAERSRLSLRQQLEAVPLSPPATRLRRQLENVRFVVAPPAEPPERLSAAREQVRRIFAEEDRAIDSLVNGENAERAAARSRAGRAFVGISRLVRDLTVIPKGARLAEPKGRWHPRSRLGRLANIPQNLWNFIPDRLDEYLAAAAERAETRGQKLDARFLRLASTLGVKADKFAIETFILRLPLALSLVQGINLLLAGTEVGTMPHAVSWAIVAGLTLLTRSFPNIGRENLAFAGKMALRGLVGGAVAYGGYLLAEGAARVLGTSITQAVTPENFSWNLLATVTAGTAAARVGSGWALGRIGNISGWTEDLVQNVFNRNGVIDEVSRFAYWQAQGQISPTAYGTEAENLARHPRQKGWAGLATYELTKNRPQNLTPETMLRTARELRLCKTALETRLATNPTRYRKEYFWDRRHQKHIITERLVGDWLNAKMAEVLLFTLDHPGWGPAAKNRIAAEMGLVLDTEIVPARSSHHHADLVAREARTLTRATLATFVLGGAALGAGWKALSASEQFAGWFHEISTPVFGPEVPLDLNRAVARRAGRLAVELGAPETLNNQHTAAPQEILRVAEAVDRLKLLFVARNNLAQNANEAAIMLRDSGFRDAAEMDHFYQALQSAGVSCDDLEIIFQAAAKSARPDPWIASLAHDLGPNSSGQIAPLAREFLKSGNLRQDLAGLVQRESLAVEIERIISNNGRTPGGESTKALLNRIGLRLDDPRVQLGYLGLQDKAEAFRTPAVIQELTDNQGKPVKLVLLGASSPVILEVRPNEIRTAERTLALLKRITAGDSLEFDRAANDPNVDFGRFVALAYEAKNSQPKAQAALAAIRQEIQSDQILDQALEGDPAAFNKLVPLLRNVSKSKLREFTGEGITPGVTSVRFWQSVLDKTHSPQEALDRSAYYFQKLPELESPRAATVTGWAKTAIEAGVPEAVRPPPTLGEAIRQRQSLEDLGLIVYPQSLRPIPVIQGEQIIRRDWQGVFFIDKPAYPEPLKRALLATEGAGDTAEPEGLRFLGNIGWRNLVLGTRSGSSGLTTQIVDWLQNGKIGKTLFSFSPEANDREHTPEFAYRLATAVLADQVPPEMSADLGLPAGSVVPPVHLPGGFPFDIINEKIHERGVNDVVDQLRQRVVAQVLGKVYSDDEISEFYLRYEPLGNVGGFEIRGFEAGARLFFGKTSEELTVPEQALLLGLSQGPGDYSPVWHPAQFVARGKFILQHYYLPRGLITPEQDARFQQYLDSGAVQQNLRKRFPITVEAGGESINIDPDKLNWQDPTDPLVRQVKTQGARLVQMPAEFANPKPETIRTPSAVDGFLAATAPANVRTTHNYLDQAFDAKKFNGQLVAVPLSPTETASLPTVALPFGLGVDIRPGVSVIIADDTGKIIETYNPSGILGPEALVEPGSATKPLFLSAMISALGVDPTRAYPAWKGTWALDGTDLVIQNPPIYAPLNNPRAVNYLYMSLADVMRGGGSANVPFNAAFRDALDKDPDAWRKFTDYLKKNYNLTLYDGDGNELFFPPATLTNVRVQQGAFVTANARILSDKANPVAQILRNDSLLNKQFKVGPNETWSLSAGDRASLSSQGGKIAQKSGTAALGQEGVGALSYLETVTGANGKSQTVFVFAKGQTLADGKPDLVNLESLYGRNGAYAGSVLRPLAQKLAKSLEQ